MIKIKSYKDYLQNDLEFLLDKLGEYLRNLEDCYDGETYDTEVEQLRQVYDLVRLTNLNELSQEYLASYLDHLCHQIAMLYKLFEGRDEIAEEEDQIMQTVKKISKT